MVTHVCDVHGVTRCGLRVGRLPRGHQWVYGVRLGLWPVGAAVWCEVCRPTQGVLEVGL